MRNDTGVILDASGRPEGEMTTPQGDDAQSEPTTDVDRQPEIDNTMVDWGSSSLHTGGRDPDDIETRNN